MKYKQFLPPAELRHHIRYFWALEAEDNGSASQLFRPVPDGCPGIIFQSDTVSFYDQQQKKLPGIFLYGQTTRQTELTCTGRFNTVGAYLYPHALKSIFGFNAYELTNTCLDLDQFSKEKKLRLYEQLQETPTAEEKVKIIAAYLYTLLQKNSAPADPVTSFALAKISGANGSISLKQLQKELQLSERSFERKFKQQVGVSAKLFSRICQFQASLNQLRKQDYEKLSDVALENDYADQSHFIRAFKEFVGISPNQFYKNSYEVVENFPLFLK